MNEVLGKIRKCLQQEASEASERSRQRFFKQEIKCHGVANPVVHDIARRYFAQLGSTKKPFVFGLCEDLWKSGYHEEALIAANWCYMVKRQFEMEDMDIFERWIDSHVSNWSNCDAFCTRIVGFFILKFPETVGRLKQWASSPNRWMRRAAAVSLVNPAKKGEYLQEILEIAGLLLMDKDDMVQKGYGWMLKEASIPNQENIFGFLMKHKDHMPRTALRYAVEKMPAEMKLQAMGR